MQVEDRITIATAEGIELQIVLAGAASRFIAAVIDSVVQVLLIVLAAILALVLVGGGIGGALLAVASFAALYLYDVLFEVLAGGRTPGKRITHLRVVRAEGTPVDLPASAIRNMLRLIDLLPFVYLVGLFTILITRRNQRLGDLAAGTLVIRDATVRGEQRGDGAPMAVDASGWDLSAVGMQELAAVRRFLERRASLDPRPREELAYRLEQGLRAKVAGAPSGIAPEAFLEALTQAKASR